MIGTFASLFTSLKLTVSAGGVDGVNEGMEAFIWCGCDGAIALLVMVGSFCRVVIVVISLVPVSVNSFKIDKIQI